MSEIKDRIKEIRRDYSLSQTEFANRLGMSRGAIGQYEIGKNYPTKSAISLICREFNINEKWLINGEGEKESDTKSVVDSLIEQTGVIPEFAETIGMLNKMNPEIQKVMLKVIRGILSEFESDSKDKK